MQGKRISRRNGMQVLAGYALAFLAGPLPALGAETIVKPPVREYEAGTIAPGEYRVIDRVSVAHWRSAFYVPASANEASAKRALLNAAARSGGDGVVNLHCIRSAGPGAGVAFGGYYCYGNVIKLK